MGGLQVGLTSEYRAWCRGLVQNLGFVSHVKAVLKREALRKHCVYIYIWFVGSLLKKYNVFMRGSKPGTLSVCA